jgi:transcriptional regulator with XRE-family HTH domain
MSSDIFLLCQNSPYNTLAMPRKRKNELPPLKLGSETIGQRLARLRKEQGLTQAELAERIGIKQTSVSDYETGRLRLNDEMLARVSLALKVSADTILGLKGGSRGANQATVRILRRLNRIASLPIPQKKALLKTIDMMLKATEHAR